MVDGLIVGWWLNAFEVNELRRYWMCGQNKTKRAKVYVGLRLVYVWGAGLSPTLYTGLTWSSHSVYTALYSQPSATNGGYNSRLRADFFVCCLDFYFAYLFYIAIIWYICGVKSKEYGKGYTCTSDAASGANEAKRLVFWLDFGCLLRFYPGRSWCDQGISASCRLVGQRHGHH